MLQNLLGPSRQTAARLALGYLYNTEKVLITLYGIKSSGAAHNGCFLYRRYPDVSNHTFR